MACVSPSTRRPRIHHRARMLVARHLHLPNGLHCHPVIVDGTVAKSPGDPVMELVEAVKAHSRRSIRWIESWIGITDVHG